MSKKSLKNLALGVLTTAMTMAPHGVKAQDDKSSDKVDNKIEYMQKKQALHDVVEQRFAETNARTAGLEADRTMLEANTMLSINDSIYTEYMKLVHEAFEEKEVHAERMKAYTVQKNDNEKLADMKREAMATYKECQRRLQLLNKADKELKDYLKKHPEVKPEAKDTLASGDQFDEYMESNENPLNADEKKLKLQQKYANAMKDLVEKQEELNKLDVPLRREQLKQDIKEGKADLKQAELDIKAWNELQAEIDKVKAALNALRLENFDNEAKQKLGENQDANNVLSDESVETANSNWDKYTQAKGLDKEIKAYKTAQLKLGENLDSLTVRRDRISDELKTNKAEQKRLRKPGNHIIEDFTKDPYEDSELQEAADAYSAASKTQEKADKVLEETYQVKIDGYYEKAESVDRKTLPNGGSETIFKIQENGTNYDVTAIRYPDGKSAIFERDKVLMYDKDGKFNQTYKIEKTSNGARLGVNARTVVEGINGGNYR